LVTFIISLLIVFLRYFYVQKIFLYLIVCHALLASMGAYYALSLNKKILNPLTKGALVILFCFSLNWHWQYYSSLNNAHSPKSCKSIEEYLDVAWQELDDIWKKVTEKETSTHPRDGYLFAYTYFDYIIERNQHLENCAWDRDPHAQKTSLCSALVGELSLDENNRVFKLDRPAYFKLKK